MKVDLKKVTVPELVRSTATTAKAGLFVGRVSQTS